MVSASQKIEIIYMKIRPNPETPILPIAHHELQNFPFWGYEIGEASFIISTVCSLGESDFNTAKGGSEIKQATEALPKTKSDITVG